MDREIPYTMEDRVSKGKATDQAEMADLLVDAITTVNSLLTKAAALGLRIDIESHSLSVDLVSARRVPIVQLRYEISQTMRIG